MKNTHKDKLAHAGDFLANFTLLFFNISLTHAYVYMWSRDLKRKRMHIYFILIYRLLTSGKQLSSWCKSQVVQELLPDYVLVSILCEYPWAWIQREEHSYIQDIQGIFCIIYGMGVWWVQPLVTLLKYSSRNSVF